MSSRLRRRLPGLLVKAMSEAQTTRDKNQWEEGEVTSNQQTADLSTKYHASATAMMLTGVAVCPQEARV